MTESGDNPKVDEIIQTHKHHKAGDFLARFAFTSLIVEDPFFIYYKK